MKSSRRSRITSNGSSKRPKPPPVSPPKPRTECESSPSHLPVAEPQAQSTTTLSAADRYEKNLKSLRRVDPTICSIIDQFSHICLYRLHDGKWQKDGYEGASFLFERCAFTLSSSCHSSHGSQYCSEPRTPLMASSFSIVPGCTITYTLSIPKTKYSRRGNT